MAFDKPTRNKLASFVSEARNLIATEFTQQFQSIYGISDKGEVTALEHLGHLDDAGLSTATLLRERIEYLVRTHPGEKDGAKAAVDRLAREQAFTILNRLAALRMAEKRDLIVESVGKGYQSKGFKVFEQVAGSGLGDTYNRYRRYLYCLFDELAVDLGVLFDRSSPQGLLFPREPALLELLKLLNDPDLDALWTEDETIGWIYQYYNDPGERKRMRDESAAPRNSRELAVRNQFFTPRYVVEFLTDNTLARIWYEMTQGETRLKEQCRYLVRRPKEIFLKVGEAAPEVSPQNGLSQEELLKQPVYIPHRSLKDPREIRMLDPACGSMHFGLYAFDLFEVIYDEAWEIAHGNDTATKSSTSFAPFVSFAATYPAKAAFLADVPRLIIEHNVHGIDIDPRCAQIAGLSLWLRAQKSWQIQKIPPAGRPQILRSNIVCAEPMPGDKAMLREFVQNQFNVSEHPAFSLLLETIFDKMQLAGEAGSLLKIEEEIRSAVEEARKLWEKIRTKPHELFSTEEINRTLRPGAQQKLGGLEQAVSLVAKDFWETAEDRIYAALRDYAEQAENGTGFQRRLFAEDAARGFAFIDICRKRYDLVLMNPPFGLATPRTDSWLGLTYSETCNDLYGAFAERGFEFSRLTNGFIGAVTTKTFLYSKRLREFRKRLTDARHYLTFLIDIGLGVLDAMVRTAVWVAGRKISPFTLFWDWTNEEKAKLSDNALTFIRDTTRPPAVVDLKQFSVLPFGLFSYWCPPDVLHAVATQKPFEPTFGESVKGLTSFDDFRFIRLHWEVRPQDKLSGDWKYIVKGGGWSRYHSETVVLIDWRKDGEIPRQNELKNYGTDARSRQSNSFWNCPGLTFGEVSDYGFSAQPQQRNNLFGGSGFCIFPKDPHLLPFWLAFFNSRPVFALLSMYSTDRHWNSEMVAKLPVPDLKLKAGRLASLGNRQFEIARSDGIKSETAPEFISYQLDRGSVEAEEFNENQREIDSIVKEAYGFSEESLNSLSAKFPVPSNRSVTVPDFGVDLALSYYVGNAFGRWDIRFATGEKPVPALPDPFMPLPVCPPGMLQNQQGLPLEKHDVQALKDEGTWNYPIEIPWHGILVDDPNHPVDIERRVREVIEMIQKDHAEAIEHEACEILHVKSLRDYFRKPAGFFADHLKRYSKSRRQAPIYWPLCTSSGSYTLWIYYHRLNENTLHTALADFIDPKLKSVRDEISYLRTNGNQQARLEELQDFEQELREFRDEIERIIKLPWKPNLNDGVLITASPLWKLFRLPKWQKDLKACWEELSDGDYDWSHLAYTIWPKRVQNACKTDRSIAIAHGLEHLCEVEAPKPKGKRKKESNASFEELEA